MGALDYLFNVYKRLLPTLGDYITNHGGRVNLSHVDVMLAEVGALEDYVFAMKHENEEQEKRRRDEARYRRKERRGQLGVKPDEPPKVLRPHEGKEISRKTVGRAARILEKQTGNEGVALQRNHQAKEDHRQQQKAAHRLKDDNLEAAKALKAALLGGNEMQVKAEKEATEVLKEETSADGGDADAAAGVEPNTDGASKTSMHNSDEDGQTGKNGKKRSLDELNEKKKKTKVKGESEDGVGDVDDDSDLFDAESSDDEGDDDDNDDEDENVDPPVIISVDPKAAQRFKDRITREKQKQ